MKIRMLLLASLVAGLAAVGCDKYNSDTNANRPSTAARDTYGTGTGADTYGTQERARAAETARPSDSDVAPSAPAAPASPVVSDDTRKDQIDQSADALKVRRDKIYDDLYGQYV